MAMATSVKMPQRAVRVRPASVRRTHVAKAVLDCNLVITGATATMLGLGRFAFLGFQRKTSAQAAAVPKTEGNTFFDDLQKPATFITSTNDPAGFNLIDVLAWGSLGHALGYLILAVSSNGYDGPFA